MSSKIDEKIALHFFSVILNENPVTGNSSVTESTKLIHFTQE